MLSVLLSARSLDLDNGGPSQNIPMLAVALKRQGLRVAVLSAQQGRFHPVLDANDVPVFVGAGGPAGFGRFLRGVLDQFAPNVVHDNGLWLPQNHAIASVCARRTIPYVVSTRGMLEPWARQYRGLKKRLAWALYQRKDLIRSECIVTTSDDERTNVQLLLPSSRVAVVPNGWSPPSTNQRPQRNSVGPRRVLFFSRIHPKKGIELLLHAWSQVRPVGWRLDIVGPGEPEYVSTLHDLAASLDLHSVVNFMPPIFEMADKALVIGSADLVVLPSYSENFGSIIVEALGLGVPVATTTGTPWREMAHRKAGWWVEASVTGIAGALREATALSDKERAAMGLRGREWVLSAFGWDAIALKMTEVYDQVLSRRS